MIQLSESKRKSVEFELRESDNVLVEGASFKVKLFEPRREKRRKRT